MSTKLVFHHFGLAVRKETQAVRFLENMDYSIGEKIFDPEQNVYLRMCTSNSSPAVEIIMPGGGDGPLTPILNKHSELVYHLCYEVQNMQVTLQELQEEGFRVVPIVGAKQAILFPGCQVSFFQVMGFGLVEFLEKQREQ